MNRQNVVPLQARDQMTLNFEPGMVERYPSAMDVMRKVAYGPRNPLKTIAADMDMSPSSMGHPIRRGRGRAAIRRFRQKSGIGDSVGFHRVIFR